MIPNQEKITSGFSDVLSESGFTDIDPVSPSEQGGWLRLSTSATIPSHYTSQAIANRVAGLLMLNNYENVHKQSVTVTDNSRVEFKARVCKPQGATNEN